MSASDTSATILAKLVCVCPASSDINSIVPISSPSAPAAPLSLTKCNLAAAVSLVVFFIIISGSVEFADVNVTVS